MASQRGRLIGFLKLGNASVEVPEGPFFVYEFIGSDGLVEEPLLFVFEAQAVDEILRLCLHGKFAELFKGEIQ